MDFTSFAVRYAHLRTHAVSVGDYVHFGSEIGAGPVVMRMPSQAANPTVLLKKGVVRTGSVAALYNWISAIQINQVDKKDVYVRLCDEKGDAVIIWRVINAFPMKLDIE